MKAIEERTMYVMFNFGSFVYLTVTMYEGKTLAENLKIRSEAIESYYDKETKKWIKI